VEAYTRDFTQRGRDDAPEAIIGEGRLSYVVGTDTPRVRMALRFSGGRVCDFCVFWSKDIVNLQFAVEDSNFVNRMYFLHSDWS
jgi:hypothetical protein